MEGHQRQIEGLRPNAIIDLYYPSSVRTAIELIRGSYSDDEPLLVMNSLKNAARVSDVVIHFWTQGKYLEAPREMRRNAQDKELAAKIYPESFKPLVSMSLLSQRPIAFVKRYPTPNNIEAVYVNVDGNLEKMHGDQFVGWFVKLVRRSRDQGKVIESRLNERYNRSVANRLIGA